ncbi:MAG: extracellular solute-binding protein, partial [Acetobacteraceae bacterium]|nr:extracellular solute-binding protein [Acetobacteraceae bacterium]
MNAWSVFTATTKKRGSSGIREEAMVRRRHVLGLVAGSLASPAIVERVGAQSSFDWKQAKGAKIEVNFAKSPRPDVLAAHQKEFEELTGIQVGFEQIPEQQQRPKVAVEFASGRPSFDVVNVALHVQKRLVEKGRWMTDLRPLLGDPTVTSPDYDFADFGGPGLKAATGPDGMIHTIPINQDLFIVFYNKKMLTQANLAFPRSLDEFYQAAKTLTDRSKGLAGFVGRGVKNANVVLWTQLMLGWDQETIAPDGKTLLTDNETAISAASYYQKLMRDCAPPGAIGFNWNESQTTFSQGRAAMWIDGVGFSAPLVDPTKSKIVHDVGFAPVPPGPKTQNSATFIDGVGIAAASKNKKAAWLYVQWATSKPMMREFLRAGAGTPARQSAYKD